MEEEAKQKFVDDFTEQDKVENESDLHDFEKEKTLIGIFLRFEAGTYGDNFIISNEKGEIKVAGYTALRDKITREDIGKKVKIVCFGEKKSKSGRSYLDFEVYKKQL